MLGDDGVGESSPLRSQASIRVDFVQKLASAVPLAEATTWLLRLLLPKHFVVFDLVMEEWKEDEDKEEDPSLAAILVDVKLAEN
ncbi:hypothetical protein SUGI_0486110 [Cryptomeria japonica]|nr:hypothetical protein SUGI_0486110 [Cryptomeria japonica]